jgi:phosphoribosylformylglycinamidine (FGAM) synthase-like amidotransferase family enzyme
MHVIYDDEYETDNPRTILLNLIENFEDTCNYAEDVAFLKVKDSAVVFTGGFSWGDSPTDSYDVIMSVKEMTIEMEKVNA